MTKLRDGSEVASPVGMRALSAVLVSLIGAGCDSSAVPAGHDATPDELPRTCVAPQADRAGTDSLVDPLGTSRVAVTDTGPCTREYTLSSTAQLRANLPVGGVRAVQELAGPTLRTGHDLFDALYALALAEVRENSVDAISDWAFADGAPQPCPPGGCFETGRLWKYVWTRDTAYSVDLGLAALDPARARNSLEYKLSAPRAGGPEQIVQDTGTGGSYPVSTDRVVWALGAGTLLHQLDDTDRQAFSTRALAALRATVEHDRAVVFDSIDGLYTGEQSFLDWREQSYPAWAAADLAHIASSKALGTNVAHLRALELAASLAGEHGDAGESAPDAGWATALRERIRERFWIEDVGLFGTFVTGHLDPAPARQYDLLGSALAVLHDVATPAQAKRIVAAYPHVGQAAPVIFPQQQLTPIYHNRAEWPFVTAYWLRAAAKAQHAEVATTAMRSLVRGAALNLSNMENFEIATGAPWVEDGDYSGPIVNSQRQLWSVAGYVSMIHHTLFGLHFEDAGLRVSPFVPVTLLRERFGRSDSLVLNDVPWRDKRLTVVLHLPDEVGDAGRLEVGKVRLNGNVVDGTRVIAYADLDPTNRIDVDLVAPAASEAMTVSYRDAANWRAIFAPRVPAVTSVSGAPSGVALDLSPNGEDPGSIRYSVYRDGQRVATNLAGTTLQYVDTAASTMASPCYAVETCFTTTGNCSQRSRPMCWWGDGGERVMTIPASAFVATGGTASTQHGRFHYESWGDATHSLVVPSVQPTRTGPHLVQLVYGNGAGGTDTGITCAVKRVQIEDVASGEIVATGHITMPHLGSWSRWADSTFVRADLDANRTYRVTIDGAPTSRNMSAFSHFATYVGMGGAGGTFERVNIAELKLLAR